MAIRRLDKSWQYDFTLQGHGRQRKAGYRTKVEAREAEQRKREDLISGCKRYLLADACAMYMSATTMKVGSRDYYERCWNDLQPHIGHLHIEEVDTSAIDALKSKFSPTLGPKSVNNRLSLLKAVLRFMWKRGHLPSVPYVPMESVPRGVPSGTPKRSATACSSASSRCSLSGTRSSI